MKKENAEANNLTVRPIVLKPVQTPENEPGLELQVQVAQLPGTQPLEDEPLQRKAYLFAEATWLPAADPLAAGPKNISTMQNLRFTEYGLESVPGYTKINATTALETYLKIRSGIQLRAPFTTKSRLLAQAYNAGLTASQVLQHTAVPPAQGDFEATELHTDASGAGLGRFAKWPGNQVAYCNGVETKIYGGDEIPAAAFITSSDPVTGTVLTKPKDYSEAVRNSLQSADQVAQVGGGDDPLTKLLLHFEGAPGAAVTDSSAAAHGNATKEGTADISVAQAKYGTGALTTPAAGDGISYADHADWDPVSGEITYETLFYLPAGWADHSLAGTLTFADNTPAEDTIALSGDHSAVAWLQAGRTICSKGGEGQTNVGPWTVGSIAYEGGTDTTTITLAAGEVLTAETIASTLYPCRSLLGRYEDANNHWFLAAVGDDLHFVAVSAAARTEETITGKVSAGWNHAGIQRDGTDAYFLVNGTMAKMTVANLPALGAAALRIGRTQRAGSLYNTALGLYFDEVRVSAVDRWAAGTTYSVPIRAYTAITAARTFLVGFTRPVQAVKFYIGSGVNTETSTTSAQEWNGVSWPALTISSDGTASTGVSLAKTGSVAFGSTVGTSIPKYIEGRILYWYQFSLSAGSAEIYQVTGDAPFQDVRDCWDGTELLLASCLVYVAGSSSYKDWTLYASVESTETAVELDALATTEHLLIGAPVPLMGFRFQMHQEAAKVNANAAAMAVAYCNGEEISAWPSVNGLHDGTAGGSASLKQTGVVSFTPVSDVSGQEFTASFNGGDPMYYYKVTFSAALSATVEAISITAIPAPRKLRPYKFPFMFLGRPMLCGYLAGNEGNRVDYGLTHAADVWNGPDSSMGVETEPLYFGGAEELTAACEIYNRLGSSVYSFGIFTKAYETYILNGYGTDEAPYRIYPVSAVMGCPAPLTMDTWQLGLSTDAQSVRSIAMWLSHQGPVIFDSGGLQPIPGIECYFDRRDSRCINYAKIENARGWFDPETGDYNLQIPTGDSSTNNVWLALNLRLRKWYPIVPSAAASPYLGAAFRVVDATGKAYIYGARDNGYLMRLHNGVPWDGTAAVQSVSPADLLVSDDPWDQIRLSRLKIFGVSATEDTDCAITHYADGATSGTTLTAAALNGANRHFRETQALNLLAWSHRLLFSASISTEAKGMRLLGWALEYRVERPDY